MHEHTDDGQNVSLPPATEVRMLDRIRVEGRTYVVTGFHLHADHRGRSGQVAIMDEDLFARMSAEDERQASMMRNVHDAMARGLPGFPLGGAFGPPESDA